MTRLDEIESLLLDARDLLVMCSLMDKSGQCMTMVDRIDEKITRKPKK